VADTKVAKSAHNKFYKVELSLCDISYRYFTIVHLKYQKATGMSCKSSSTPKRIPLYSVGARWWMRFPSYATEIPSLSETHQHMQVPKDTRQMQLMALRIWLISTSRNLHQSWS